MGLRLLSYVEVYFGLFFSMTRLDDFFPTSLDGHIPSSLLNIGFCVCVCFLTKQEKRADKVKLHASDTAINGSSC